MGHLAVLTGASVAGADVTYVDRVSAPRAPTTVSNVGVRLPAHLTATGRAALAMLSRDQVRALYPHRDALYRRVGPGPATLGELDALLRDTRRRGWAREDGEITAGYASVAAAAVDRNGYPVASVGVTFRVESAVSAGVETERGAAVEAELGAAVEAELGAAVRHAAAVEAGLGAAVRQAAVEAGLGAAVRQAAVEAGLGAAVRQAAAALTARLAGR
ncbi:IclR family transcriptional regulator C-terminal domain-containing protein [Microbacterium sp. 10M-3C3]|uniref:IclR family transcriptional regulator domain-containing protein n=1 Tax=Microbacterium sp. 10M-3C3 TaxID=2483401 RepID=UPI00197C1A15|nr:IclR family transcriptional regulator C-terminal domain-containing protein [Microbacterium sp. 10M-3C3]